ncbi:hypothetical protein O0L34_g18321 [Tuta absoluta]|nr:hypothetical protein O0L34_g18321 [Tuta absoluta]
MWKLVVLCVVLRCVPGESGAVLTSPFIGILPYSSAFIAPAVATVTKQASSVVHPSPYLTYSSPYFGHFIKKRSAPLFAAPYIVSAVTYTSPLPYNSYAAPTSLPAAPVVAHAPLTYTHLIKKRSAPLFTTPYFGAPRIPYVPVLHYPYAANLLPAGEVYAPGLYRHPHVIKKRTLDLLSGVFRWFFSSNSGGGGGNRNNNRW